MLDDPADVLADMISRLDEGAVRRKSPLHTPVVGTGDGDMRVMVLRAFDPGTWTLRFHTDARSTKVGLIGGGADGGARMGVLFYDPAAKIQIRARGLGRIETDGPVAEAAWEASTNFARRCYLATSAPGAAAAGPISGLPPEFEGIEPDDAQLLPARPNFAVLLVTLHTLDWLYLANTGHRRAQFARTDANGWEGRWVIP